MIDTHELFSFISIDDIYPNDIYPNLKCKNCGMLFLHSCGTRFNLGKPVKEYQYFYWSLEKDLWFSVIDVSYHIDGYHYGAPPISKDTYIKTCEAVRMNQALE